MDRLFCVPQSSKEHKNNKEDTEKKGGLNMARIMITEAKYAGDLTVELTFNDHTSQRINIGEYIRQNPHPQYNKYLDETEFKRFTIEDGNIVWGEDWDLIFPIEELHNARIFNPRPYPVDSEQDSLFVAEDSSDYLHRRR